MSSNIILNKQVLENKQRDVKTSNVINNIIKKSQKNIIMKNIQKELNNNSSKVSIFSKNDLLNTENIYKKNLMLLEMIKQKQHNSIRNPMHNEHYNLIQDSDLLKKNS